MRIRILLHIGPYPRLLSSLYTPYPPEAPLRGSDGVTSRRSEARNDGPRREAPHPPTVHRSPCSLFTPPQGPRFPCPFPHHTRGPSVARHSRREPAPRLVGLSLRSRFSRPKASVSDTKRSLRSLPSATRNEWLVRRPEWRTGGWGSLRVAFSSSALRPGRSLRSLPPYARPARFTQPYPTPLVTHLITRSIRPTAGPYGTTMERMRWWTSDRNRKAGTKYILSLRFHSVTSSLTSLSLPVPLRSIGRSPALRA